MEWDEDWDEGEHPHRHVSQLFDVFPGFGISPSRTPELVDAARRTLDLRGETGTGWAFAWKIALSARLGDADRGVRQIGYLLNPVSPRITQYGDDGGGIYPNLLSACPPFEIDANFGYTAGVAEMLLQSHEDAIVLLPVLPETWSDGAFSGLRARGGIELGLTWANGLPCRLTLSSRIAQRCRIRFRDAVLDLDLPQGNTVVHDWKNEPAPATGEEG
jgi:alpha-L-fucosidase 2